jgi:hypothetical protein
MRLFIIITLAACSRTDTAPAVAPRAPSDAPIAIAVVDAPATEPCPVAQASLGPGLVVERWHVAGAKPAVGEPCIDVVRADLNRYALRAFHDDGVRRNAQQWRVDKKLVAVTNAGMFHDGGAPVGLVKSGGKTTGIDNKKFGGYFAFDPSSPKFPAVAMPSRTCSPNLALDVVHDNYRSLVQSYRLLGCDGKALPWKDPKQYSAAAIGKDKRNNVVFIHVRAGFTMAELSAALAEHELEGAIFLEGGPEASLVVHGSEGALERVGSYETNFVENDDNKAFWDLPNVIGLEAI